MLCRALLIFGVISSAPAFAQGGDKEFSKADREISSFNDLFRGLDDLNCTPKCGGAAICGEFREMNTCLDEGDAADCFWSCE